MLTRRGFWLLLFLIGLVLGAATLAQDDAVVATLTVLLWFGGEWVAFVFRVRWVVPRLTLERLVDAIPAQRATLWADRPAQMAVAIHCPSFFGLPFAQWTDRLPALGTATGHAEVIGSVGPRQPLRLAYEYRCAAPGKVRFEGVKLSLSDFQGFFHRDLFVHAPAEVNVLPPLVDFKGHRPMLKRINVLPTHGVHRHLRPGSGSELLDLRDYLPGDPPKSIAWKVSARRDKLMTREYESEVPVRCTLFLDVSNSMRVGPPGRTALHQAVRIAATFAQRLLAARDPVGLCLFGTRSAAVLPGAVGNRQLVRIHARLASAARFGMGPTECPVELLFPPLLDFCREVYPQLLAAQINRFEPWYRRWGFLSFRGVMNLIALPAVIAGMVSLLTAGRIVIGPWFGLLYAVLSSIALWFFRPKLKRSRPERYYRKPLAALLAQHYELGPAGLVQLNWDDGAFSRVAQQFLLEHQVMFPRPLYGADGEYLFTSGEKLAVLSRYLLRSFLHGRDNELFVLMVDLLELPDEWDALLRVIRVAVARHHQVVLVCPWPEGLKPPGTTRPADAGTPTSLERPSLAKQPELLFQQFDQARFEAAFTRLQHELSRLRVSLIAASPTDSVPYLLERIERIRAARVAPRG